MDRMSLRRKGLFRIGEKGNDVSPPNHLLKKGVSFMRKLCLARTSIVILAIPLFISLAMAGDVEPITKRVSVRSDGMQANGIGYGRAISANGRYVAFESEATNLVADDTNARKDIFVHDHMTGSTTRVSVGYGNTESNKQSSAPSISNDGRYVAFKSYSDNLVPNDNSSREDVFVHDRWMGTNEIINIGPGGVQANGSTFYRVVISGNGRFVFFVSEATNLIPEDTNGAIWDIFVHDRETHITSLASLADNGDQPDTLCESPSVSSDGRFVTFVSKADNIIADEVNGRWHIFVHDRTTGRTTLVSVSSSGEQGDSDSSEPSISADGRFVAFSSQSSNLAQSDVDGFDWDIFVHDRQTGETKRITESGSSFSPSISSDGHYIAYRTTGSIWESNWISYYLIFFHDLWSNNITLISKTTDGNVPGISSYDPAISMDGRYVIFSSSAANLVTGDTNEISDIFLRGPLLSLPNGLSEILMSLRMLSGISSDDFEFPADINGDGKIGLAEVIHLMRRVSGLIVE